MEKDRFDINFDIAFQNALRNSDNQITVPEDHVILESWKVLRIKLETYCNEHQETIK